MKKLLIILTLISVFACEITREPYNGEKAILASIEKSEKELADASKASFTLNSYRYAEFYPLILRIQENGLGYKMMDILDEACPDISGLMSSLGSASESDMIDAAISLMGDDGSVAINTALELERYYDQARAVDFSNKEEVEGAIKKIEQTTVRAKELTPALMSSVFDKVEVCAGNISDVVDDLIEQPPETTIEIPLAPPIETEIIIDSPIVPPLQAEIILEPIETIEIPVEPVETDQEKEDREEEERLEQERLDRLDRLEQERLEQERLDEQRWEQERLEAQRLEREFEEQVSQALLARQERIAVARRGDNRHYYYVIEYDESFNKFSDGERAVKDGRLEGSLDIGHYWMKYNDELAVIEGEENTSNSFELFDIYNAYNDELFEIKREINLRTDFSDRQVIEDILYRIDEIVIRHRFALKRYVDQYR